MVEGNPNNSVRDRISMLVDAQEGGVMRPNEVAQNNDAPKNRKNFLKALIPVLAVAVVGVVVAIVVVNLPSGDGRDEDDILDFSSEMGGYDGELPDSTIAFIFSERIKENLVDDSYTSDDAIRDYDAFYDSVEGDLKLHVALRYAEFLHDELDDIDEAIRVLEKTGDSFDDVVAVIERYKMLRNLYMLKGDNEKAQYYDEIIARLDGEPVEVPLDVILKAMGGESGE